MINMNGFVIFLILIFSFAAISGMNGNSQIGSEAINLNEDESIIYNTCISEEFNLTKDQCAYVLATANHETAGFSHMSEIDGQNQAIRLGYNGGKNWFGRGYAMLTGQNKYQMWSSKDVGGLGWTNQDLVSNPDLLVTDKALSARILVSGMKYGSFSGAGNGTLETYINNNKVDFISARKIVNGNDKASQYAKTATDYAIKLKEIK